MGQSIDDIFGEILEAIDEVSKEAINIGAKRVQEKIKDKAKESLLNYYKWKPKRYKRLGPSVLGRVIRPYKKTKAGASVTSVEVGVRYDASWIEGLHKSNSRFHQSGGEDWKIVPASVRRSDASGSYGVPNSEWIMENFIQGLHPIPLYNFGSDQYSMTYKEDAQSTQTLMTKYIESSELESEINEIFQECFVDAIMARIG